MTEMQLYWLLKLDDLKHLCNSFSAMFLTVGIIMLLITTVSKILQVASSTSSFEDDKKLSEGAKQVFKFTLPLMIIGMSIGLIFEGGRYFIPSTKQMAIIYVVPKIVNNKQIQEIPNRMLTLANEWLEELRPEKNKVDIDSLTK